MRKILTTWLVLLVSMAAISTYCQVRIPGPGGTAHSGGGGPLWQGVLSSLRAMDWSQNGASIQTRTTQCGLTIPAYTGPSTTISAALTACAGLGQYVQLGAGTFTLSNSLVTTASGVTLRGMGANQTFLNFTAISSNCNGVGGTAICIWNGDSNSFQFPGAHQTNWTSNFTKGATIIGVASSAGINPGQILILSQNDDASDNGNVYVCQQAGNLQCSQQGGTGVARAGAAQTQNVTVVSVSVNNITISPAIAAPNWSLSKAPVAWWSNNAPLTGFGLEDMSVNYASLGSQENGIEFHLVRDSWIKHLRSINNGNGGAAVHKHVNIYDSNHITVRDSYFYGASPTSEGYGVDNGPGSANNLAENNIYQHMPTAQIGETTCCDVYGYTYSVDDFYNNGAPAWQQQNGFHHGAGDNLMLWEDDEGIGWNADDIHGTSFFLTQFRSYLNGRDPTLSTGVPKSQSTFAYFPFAFARYNHLIGSVLGTQSYHHFYINSPLSDTDCSGSSGDSSLSVLVFGFSDQGGTAFNNTCIGAPFTINNDALVQSSTVLWGNYAACSVSAECNAVRFQTSEDASSAAVYPGLAPPSMSLPPSFYLSSKPAFLGSRPWPLVGPDVTGGNISGYAGHANHNAAADCYLNVMGGQTDGSSGPLTFNPALCGY